MIDVAIVGASGYIGGELLRLLLSHPEVRVAACTSRRSVRRRVDSVHPHLRGLTDLVFADDDQLGNYDTVFLALPHGRGLDRRKYYESLAPVTVDLSSDYRLRDQNAYERHYGHPHPEPDRLADWTTGLPELHRDRLRIADRISIPGCMATAVILALHPLVEAGLITRAVDVDARTGSSGSGTRASEGDSHPERSGSLRVFAPTTHRHEAEIEQATGLEVRMSATGVEAVRGVQVLCTAGVGTSAGETDLWRAYRRTYAGEPFVRVVARRHGWFRYPEPKLLSGTNYCDVGFALDVQRGRVVTIAALDNLVKGGAGNAVQSFNLRHDLPESTGLTFTGLHPS